MNDLVMDIRASGLVGSNGGGGDGDNGGGRGTAGGEGLTVDDEVDDADDKLDSLSLIVSGTLISISDKLFGRLSKFSEVDFNLGALLEDLLLGTKLAARQLVRPLLNPNTRMGIRPVIMDFIVNEKVLLCPKDIFFRGRTHNLHTGESLFKRYS